MMPANYAMPFAVGAPPLAPAAETASPLPVAPPANSAEITKCLAEGATANDCKAALDAIAKDPAQYPRVGEAYKRGCTLKSKVLLGCGAFKSTVLGESDRPAMDLLMLCEAGVFEACEDVKTKAAPLLAWHSTLKTEGCKKGHTALCKSFKECKKKTLWTCGPVTGGTGEACGCQPKCDGDLVIGALPRTWSDGKTRASYTCKPKP